MNKIVFLQPNSTVVPTEDRDYPEWHLGREHYALWYIEVNDPVLVSYLTQLREQFQIYFINRINGSFISPYLLLVFG